MTNTTKNPLLDPAVIPTIDTRIEVEAKDGAVHFPVMATGTWAWGDTSVWQYKPEDLNSIEDAFKTALTLQGGFFDTAEVYARGESEKILGACIAALPEEERSKVIVATKVLPLPNPMHWSFLGTGIVDALRASLKRLGLKQVDLFQIHGPVGYRSWAAQGRDLAQCVHLGLAKTVGVSNFSQSELIKISDVLASHGVKLASNQIELNLLRQSPLKNGLMEEMNKRGVVCLAYSPLAQGRLTGKYSAEHPPPKGRKFSNIPMETIDPLVEEMKRIAEARGISVSAIALNWVLSKGAIPLGGAKNSKQAEQNAQALGFRLSEGEIARLEALGQEGKTSFWQHG